MTRCALMMTSLLLACGGSPLEDQSGADLTTQTGQALKAKRTRMPRAPSYALKTTDEHVVATTPVWKTSFPIYSTYEVQAATEITGTLSGRHHLSVFVFTPSGASYIRYDVAFATDVAAGPGEQQAEKTSTGWRVWVSMPVAGTMIQTSNLIGNWSAQTWVDGTTAASATAAFAMY